MLGTGEGLNKRRGKKLRMRWWEEGKGERKGSKEKKNTLRVIGKKTNRKPCSRTFG